jgi:hypothetical protein
MEIPRRRFLRLAMGVAALPHHDLDRLGHRLDHRSGSAVLAAEERLNLHLVLPVT